MRILAAFSGHDASATIVNDGKIEYYFKEERYSRKKHSKGSNNILKMILKNGLLNDVDYMMFTTHDSQEVKDKKNAVIMATNPNIKFIEPHGQHHLFHASNSFYNSGFDKSLVIVIDASGGPLDDQTFECDSVYLAEYPCKFTKIYKRYWTSKKIENEITIEKNGCTFMVNNVSNGIINIGNLYNSAALAIGQTIDDCGKAMGLSSYGNRIPHMDLMGESASNHVYSYFRYHPEVLNVLREDGPDRAHVIITEENYQFFADYCCEVQNQCQQYVIDLVRKSIEKTGVKNVCLSGGYAMNIVTNYELIKAFPDVKFYFEPVCDDSGISTGAAMNIYRKITKDTTIHPIQTTSYHGFTHDLSSYHGTTIDVSGIASLLYQDKSVGVFCGHAEAGQRALGSRSILFNPLNPNAREVVNSIKRREWYRPFAAMVLEEDAHLYFDDIVPSPYMTLCFPVKSDIIPGVTHIDGTCRVQTVSSGHMYDILQEFKKLTGHGILLNTSFNLAGQPLVETPEEAFDTLNESSLDYLWFYETKQLFNSTF